MLLKIGELAGRTGLTVRTLHHYDAIGLLRPSTRSEAGHRLYNRADIARLYRIQALRRLDLPLADIAGLLEGGIDLQAVIQQQIAALEAQAQRAVELRDRLASLSNMLADHAEPDLNDWLTTLALMALYDKYFTPQELAALRSGRTWLDIRRRMLDAIAAMRDLMRRTIPPGSTEATALARHWLGLMQEFMGGNARLMFKHDTMHRNEPSLQALTGVDQALIEYITHATAAYRLERYARYLDADQIEQVRGSYFRHYARWPALFATARELLDRQADVAGTEVQDLCRRWIALFHDSWGSDPKVRQQVVAANRDDPEILTGSGVDAAMIDFIARGVALAVAQHGARPA